VDDPRKNDPKLSLAAKNLKVAIDSWHVQISRKPLRAIVAPRIPPASSLGDGGVYRVAFGSFT
jgi:hypothetical protein